MMSKEQFFDISESWTERIGILQRQLLRGESVTRGSITVTPIARRVSLGLPGWLKKDEGLVFIYQRPAALVIKRGESTQTIPIHDLQQIIILSMLALTALVLYILIRPQRSKRNR